MAAALLAVLVPATALSQGEQPAPDAKDKGKDKAAKQKAAPAGPPKLDARAWILIDPRDDEVLASSAPNRELPIASATKLMTARLALKELRAGEKLEAPPYQALPAESLLGLHAGEKMTVRDLLYALVLESANDAAATIATGVSGSVPRFVNRMNREAAALGLEHTSYANPIGLDDPSNYSSAADLAELAGLLLRNRLFARVADTQVVTLRSGDSPRRIDTRNTLLNLDPTADGVKTGHTQGAGYVLVGSATRDGTRLVSAVLGARSEAARDAETLKLLDYGFSLYRAETPVTRGQELADPKLDYRDERLALVAQRPVADLGPRGSARRHPRRGARRGQRRDREGGEAGPCRRHRRRQGGRRHLAGRLGVGRGRDPLREGTGRGRESPDLAARRAVRDSCRCAVGASSQAFRARRRTRTPTRARGAEGAEEAAAKRRDRGPQERTPEERRQMHEERMRRRQERAKRNRPSE